MHSPINDLDAACIQYLDDNPQMWAFFIRFAFEAINAGRVRLSASLILERIRWEVYVIAVTEDEYKINNNHQPYLARKFMREFPQYEGYFEIRAVREWREEWESYDWDDSDLI